LPLLLAIVLAAIFFMFRRGEPDSSAQPEQMQLESGAAPNARSVQLTIDFGDNRKRVEFESRWREGMTVGDLLNSEPRINLASTDSGAGAFLTSLAGMPNEGANGRNWTYRVNGKHADRSFAVYELGPGDQVLWTFAKQ
jgi:hypothetical protein